MRFIRNFLYLVVLILAACEMPVSQSAPISTTSGAEYTEAVSTVVAQLTQAAATPSATQSFIAMTTPTGVDQTIEATQVEEVPTTTAKPTETKVASPTASPTAFQPTATFSASDPRTSLGQPDFEDDFNDADNWPLYSDDHTKMEIKEGKLVMVALQADYYNSWVLSWPTIEDFYLEAKATPRQCSGRDRYGIMFRAPEANRGYLFAFSCNGQYSLWVWDGKKEIDIIDWTASEHILAGAGETNRIGVRMEGRRITLYANGMLLAEVKDDTFSKGSFGLFIGAAQTKGFTVRVDELAYWDLD